MAAVAAILTRCASAIAATVPTVALPSGLATMSSSVFLLGTAVGSFVLGGVATRYGEGTALALLAAPLLLALAPGRRLATTLAADAARLVSDQESAARVAADVAAGRHLPLLACRGVDYAYGQLQVLFGVDFTVDEGELVALLGTNGAGKSSLLRAVSGLGLPTGGTIHLRGREITRLPAAARVGLGVVQVPGGRAVFPPLSVVDNLRVYANSLGRDRRAVDRGLDRSFELFPALAAARNKPAGALSGGQQQMLALSKALILRPELLLIDELSLGLAPKVVGELLEAVRAINADGAAVVLVEQSVNVAASVATHAYFMEKGRVLFDGPTAGLMERTDLLRAVFLGDTDPSGTSKRR
jgi:ABC-type branched-subunit amino acid transport system ATPase component